MNVYSNNSKLQEQSDKDLNNFIDFWKLPETTWELVQNKGVTFIGKRDLFPDVAYTFEHGPKLYKVKGTDVSVFAEVTIIQSPIGWKTLLEDETGVVLASCNYEQTAFIFNFNVEKAMDDLLTERYLQTDSVSKLRDHARRIYYRLRPILPRAIQMSLRRYYSGQQSKHVFPAFPIEDSLHWLRSVLFWCVACAKQETGLDHIDFWPEGKRFCVVLTHDVEQATGVQNIAKLVEAEKKMGVRSCFNFVPERYPFDREVLSRLQADGFEVGVHGLNHDGRLFESKNTFLTRAHRINTYAKDWSARGFRSPACHRVYDWMKNDSLEFDYDSSFPDTDPYQPMPGGCCSLFPWFLGSKINSMIELPITMPQDHVLWETLSDESGVLWRKKADYIESRGGMACIIVHPDYLTLDSRWKQYEELVRYFQSKPGVWFALPSTVSSWWQARNAADLIQGKNGVQVVDGLQHLPDGLRFHVQNRLAYKPIGVRT